MMDEDQTKDPLKSPQSGKKKKSRKFGIRVFLVVQRNNVDQEPARVLRDNILCAKLNLKSAQKVVDKIPGTYIIKLEADKE